MTDHTQFYTKHLYRLARQRSNLVLAKIAEKLLDARSRRVGREA